jgi:hypothetical protein
VGVGGRTSGPSRCPFRRFGKGQRTQVFGGLGCPAARRKECPFVSLQKLNPVADIARAPNVAVKAKFRRQERGAEFRNQFFRGVLARSEPMLEVAVKP